MEKNNHILITGGSGLLGMELQKYFPNCNAPDHTRLDITDLNSIHTFKGTYPSIDIVIHCAAYTKVERAETDRAECFNVNVIGTHAIAEAYHDAYFVYISSEYASNPVNFYSYTKLWGEEAVKKNCKNNLIIRTLFKANPFPYAQAFIDQYTYGDYVDVIAPMIVKEIFFETKGLINLGTGRKSIFELARRTRPDISGISVDDVKTVHLPREAKL